MEILRRTSGHWISVSRHFDFVDKVTVSLPEQHEKQCCSTEFIHCSGYSLEQCLNTIRCQVLFTKQLFGIFWSIIKTSLLYQWKRKEVKGKSQNQCQTQTVDMVFTKSEFSYLIYSTIPSLSTRSNIMLVKCWMHLLFIFSDLNVLCLCWNQPYKMCVLLLLRLSVWRNWFIKSG